MTRREAVQYISILLGGTMVGADAILTGCKTNDTKDAHAWDADDIAYLDEVADTILPTTAASPGAKAAQTGKFMTVMVNDCYEDKDQKIFRQGLSKLNEAADKAFNKKFMELAPEQRLTLLTNLDKEQKNYTMNKKPTEDAHYFRMMKELTLLGFFTSEIGCTKARRYVETPGKFDPCVPYKKGDKAWA